MPDSLWVLGNNETGKVALYVHDGSHGLAAFSRKRFAMEWAEERKGYLGAVKPGKASIEDAKELARCKAVRFIHILDDFLVPLTIEV